MSLLGRLSIVRKDDVDREAQISRVDEDSRTFDYEREYLRSTAIWRHRDQSQMRANFHTGKSFVANGKFTYKF